MSPPCINENDTNSPINTQYSHNPGSFNCTHFSNGGLMLNVNNTTATDERSEILAWLSPLEPCARHRDLRNNRADTVGEWLLRTDEFQRWCNIAEQNEQEHATLFYCSDPAVGKTYFRWETILKENYPILMLISSDLSSLVVDRLCDKAKEENIAVACFYVDFVAREKHSPTNIFGSLLKQIIGGLEGIPDEISRAFRDHNKVIGRRELRVQEVVEMLQPITSLRPTFICVDGLDECMEVHRQQVLDSFRQILEKSSNTRIFLTGRRHIRREIERHLGGRAAILPIKPSNDDIGEFIRMRLRQDTALDGMGRGLEAKIIKTVTENIPETFLLISATMDAILPEATTYDRRQRLRTITEGLDLRHVYGATIKRIMEQGGEKTRLGRAALMWISHSEPQLQFDELSHALAVEMGSADLVDERIPSVEQLLRACRHW